MNVFVKGTVLKTYTEFREKANRHVNFAVIYDGDKDNIIVMDVPSVDVVGRTVEYKCALYNGQYGVSFKFITDENAAKDEITPSTNKPNGLK